MDLVVPLSCLGAQPCLPNCHQPKQNWTRSRTPKIRVNPTQVSEQINHPVVDHHQATHTFRSRDLAFKSSTHCGPTMMAKMFNRLSLINFARVMVTLTCLILFVLQSNKEIAKFFSNMTSVSTHYMSGIEADIRLPHIVICAAEPFKSDKFPETLDEYRNLTYSKDEIIATLWPEETDDGTRIKVTEIATISHGMCLVLETPSWLFIGLNLTQEVVVYFVDHGQELCIISGTINCDVPIQSMVLNKFYHDAKIAGNKIVREER